MRASWLVMMAIAFFAAGPAPASDESLVKAGEGIYRAGFLPDHTLVHAERGGGLKLQGEQAACVNCHRRSGLGGFEGTVLIPPVIGPYLFRDAQTNRLDLSLPHLPGYAPIERPYDLRTLALALRTGRASDGRELSALMPRYALDDGAVAALAAYLAQLSSGPMPGVGQAELEFATVMTPDTAPANREAVTGVLQHYFDYRNARIAAQVQSAAKDSGQYRASRLWRLQVWSLAGPPSDWQRQLHEHQMAHPVFALVSGLGGADWTPVHRFCEQERVPCLLPNVELPVVAEQDFFSIYFSRGVLLESDLMAAALRESANRGAGQVVQIYRSGDVGAAAAATLSTQLEHEGRRGRHIRLNASGSGTIAELRAAVASVAAEDSLVLWLRSEDLAALSARPPTERVLVSGLMAGLERAPLNPAWKTVARMTYPFDPPDRRRVRMNFPHAWLRAQGIAPANDLLQSNTWLACNILDDVIDSMLDSYVPAFLVERFELMLGPRLNNAYFPRLGLAAGQRFASKGGYWVGFDAGTGSRLRTSGDWIVP